MLLLNDIAFRYSRSHSNALDGVSCAFNGGRVAILGPNGAGKSTLLRILATIEAPTSGGFSLNGLMVSGNAKESHAYRSRLGYVPQSLQMFEGYRCEQFLRYVSWLRRIPVKNVESQIDEALDAVALGYQRRERIGSLSEGMRRRLCLAQALLNHPEVLILDEPTVGLDPEQRVDYREHLKAISDRTTIVFATHLVEDVAEIATELMILDGGRLRFAGSVTEFCGGEGADTSITGNDIERRYLTLMKRRTT